MQRVLITGGGGFVGSHLKDLLNNSTGPKGKYIVEGFDLTSGQDVRDFEIVRSKIDSFHPDYIFHLAAQAYVPESTMNPYGVTKLAATTLAMTYSKIYGIKVVCTRAWNHIGPGGSPSYAVSAFSKRVAEAEKYGTPIIHGNLDAIRNYTDVRDIVQAYLLAIELEPGIYNIASSNTVPIKEILNHLASLASCKVSLEENTHLHRPMSNKFPAPNTEKFSILTGWSPKISLQQTLLDCLNYWRKQV